ncbi:ATP-binding protein, partial [Pseudoalteromonas sp. SIMBA_148]
IHFADSIVEVSLHGTARTVTIDIFNDGKLLPDYAIAKAFERYFSLSHQSQPTYQTAESKPATNAGSTLKKGTGLGLTLVKQVIEHHGGQVTISNTHA